MIILYFLIACFDISFSAADDGSIYDHLSTKTPYRFVSNENTDLPGDQSQCARKIWTLVRHGTRYPGDDDIIYMNEDLVAIRDHILQVNEETENFSEEQLQLFRQWTPAVSDVEVEEYLVYEGEVENFEMGLRMQARYPYLLPRSFSNDTYRIRYTKEQRTKESARNYANGLFGENLDGVYLPEATDEELLVLRFYKYCSKYIDEVDENPDAWIEQVNFENSEVMRNVVASISQKLGFNAPLKTEDVLMIYKTCGYETAWFRNETSPWCIPFDVDTIKVFEYYEDLEAYWIDGYGHEITYKQACTTFQDLIKFFDDTETDRTATLYFTHSGALMKFIAHLGLYEEPAPLLHTDFGTNDDRDWRMSKIGSFATNLAFVLHDCGDSRQVSLLHNERLVRIPACPDDDLCDLEIVRAYYDESINNCDFDAMCENNLNFIEFK